jgi:periplasmic mercuric ion binding protein
MQVQKASSITIKNLKMESINQNNNTNNIKIMSKNVILGMMLLIIAFSTQAQEKKNKNAKHKIVVNGNCEHCQQRIQKAAFSVAGVKSASWNIETHYLNLTINEEKTSVTAVKKAVAKVGHDTDSEKAPDAVYEKLPECCQYQREEKK